MLGGMRVIALEEHYWDPGVAKHFDGNEGRSAELRRRLDDLGSLRLQEMDDAGIDLQVLSHGNPGVTATGRGDRGPAGAASERQPVRDDLRVPAPLRSVRYSTHTRPGGRRG
jgi:hypothetical protein